MDKLIDKIAEDKICWSTPEYLYVLELAKKHIEFLYEWKERWKEEALSLRKELKEKYDV